MGKRPPKPPSEPSGFGSIDRIASKLGPISRIPVPWDASGAIGLLMLAHGAEKFTVTELATNQAKMSWLVQYVHAAMARLRTPKLAPESRVILTSREKEVLRWTAEGKTAY